MMTMDIFTRNCFSKFIGVRQFIHIGTDIIVTKSCPKNLNWICGFMTFKTIKEG